MDRPAFRAAGRAAILASLEAAQEPHNATQTCRAEWAARTESVLRERSPLSMAVSLEVVTRADDSMAECLRRDLDLTRSTFAHGDVMEGIRARIIDKDNLPHWRFARIEDVRVEDVERMFESPWPAANIRSRRSVAELRMCCRHRAMADRRLNLRRLFRSWMLR